MDQPSRILIVSASAGAGHLRPAQAIEQADSLVMRYTTSVEEAVRSVEAELREEDDFTRTPQDRH